MLLEIRLSDICDIPRKSFRFFHSRGLTQAAAAGLLEIDQLKISALTRSVGWISLDRLVRFLVLFGSDVEIVVKPRARAAGCARVMVA